MYHNGNGNVTIDFNICESAFRTCPDNYADFANIVNENNTCSHMSSASLGDVLVTMIDSDYPELGLILNFTGGNTCNATSSFNLIVQLNCD